MIKTIGIIGTGGIGGYFGAKLCKAAGPDQEIFFLARGAHLDAIREKGLTVKTVSEGVLTCRPSLASDDMRQFPALDFCLVTVKGFDLEETLASLKERVTKKTVILSLLNGIDIDRRVRNVIPGAVVLPGCTYISSHIEAPGVVAQTGGPCKIIFGNDPARPGTSQDEILQIFENARINHEWVEDPYPRIWEKYIFIAPFSLVSACFDKTIGEVLASGNLRRLVQAIMNEIVRLTREMGISPPESTAADLLERAKGFPPETRTSFQKDFMDPQKRDEREIFGGAILRLCEEHGLSCETTREIYERLNALKPPQS